MLAAIGIDYQLSHPLDLHARFEVRGLTVLVGRSGAGKTSLLRALAGLLPAVGAPWGGVAAARRRVGYVPQDVSLFPHLTVLENAAFALVGKDRLVAAAGLLGALGVGHLAARGAREISGGEAQRVALARALGAGPELLLLDEPSAALDAATRDEVLSSLIEAIAQSQVPALVATHDFAVAALADWVVLLDGGRVIQEGAPGEVFEQPASAAAARLVGYQNVWSEGGQGFAIRAEHVEIADCGREACIATSRGHGGGVRLTTAGAPGFVVLLPRGRAECYKTGQTVHLRFPARKLKILAG